MRAICPCHSAQPRHRAMRSVYYSRPSHCERSGAESKKESKRNASKERIGTMNRTFRVLEETDEIRELLELWIEEGKITELRDESLDPLDEEEGK